MVSAGFRGIGDKWADNLTRITKCAKICKTRKLVSHCLIVTLQSLQTWRY